MSPGSRSERQQIRGTLLAGPFCGQLLGDFGAEVIKVERPGEGDLARGYDHLVHGTGSHFVWLNRGKESVVLDIKKAEDNALLQRMIGETVTVDIEPGGGVWPVLAVRSQLEQVVLNLTLNARDALSLGGRIEVFVRSAMCALYPRTDGLPGIEDTDEDRSTPEYEAVILRDFRWLGVDWDERIEVLWAGDLSDALAK